MDDHKALAAAERGVRIYTHNRLAAAPSLLAADTNMHGFRMTDYLDGVVYADFIDEQPLDYVATDRQSIRWESPLLKPLHKFLSDEIKEACKQRQKARDLENEEKVRKDFYTMQLVQKAGLTKRQEKAAFRIAGTLASLHKKSFEDPFYKTQFEQVMHGFGKGEILSALSSLASDHQPELALVVAQVTRLTAEELDGFYQYVKGRLDGIAALQKIVLSTDFTKKKNEKELHKLLENNPWLIDPTFFEYVSSNRSEKTMYKEIEKKLRIGRYVPDSYDSSTKDEQDEGAANLRPDLVFLIGDSAGTRLLVVELKAPNTPLHIGHFQQLKDYVGDAEDWLEKNGRKGVSVEGILIGSMSSSISKSKQIIQLDRELKESQNRGKCRVYSLSVILEATEKAHKGILDRCLNEVQEDTLGTLTTATV